MKRVIREALPSDMAGIKNVIAAAKDIMRQSGNVHQWAEDYPSEKIITTDMKQHCGFVILEDNTTVGYFAFIPSPEPTYHKIYEGRWIDEEKPYHVVHRIASYAHVHGIFNDIINFCLTNDNNIRIDTHRDNSIMQHNLIKHGFSYCGIIYLANGDERLAYQKIFNT